MQMEIQNKLQQSTAFRALVRIWWPPIEEQFICGARIRTSTTLDVVACLHTNTIRPVTLLEEEWPSLWLQIRHPPKRAFSVTDRDIYFYHNNPSLPIKTCRSLRPVKQEIVDTLVYAGHLRVRIVDREIQKVHWLRSLNDADGILISEVSKLRPTSALQSAKADVRVSGCASQTQ